MKRIVLAVSFALILSLIAGGVLIASAASQGGLLSQAVASVKQAIAPLGNVQGSSASGIRDNALSGLSVPEQTEGDTFKQPKEVDSVANQVDQTGLLV